MSDLIERLQDPMQFTWDMRLEATARIEELEAQVAALETKVNLQRNYILQLQSRNPPYARTRGVDE